MGFFKRLIEAAFETIKEGPPPPRTLCCDVEMDDLWMHAKDCPNSNATLDKIKAWRAANPKVSLTEMPHSVDVPPLGSHSMCPHCGWPTGFFGVYVVGEKCPWCSYVEKRT